MVAGMRARVLLAATLVVGILLGGPLWSATADEASHKGSPSGWTLRFASGFAAVSPYEAEGSKFWMKRVTEVTHGRVQFEYYPAGQLAKPDKQLALAASGVADVAMVTANLE